MKTLTKQPIQLQERPGPTGLFSFKCVAVTVSDDDARLNALVRSFLGYGLIMDVQRPLDMDQLRADYRNHKIVLDNGATIERLVPAPIMRNYLVPVLISRTLQDPLKPSRAIQFYVKVKADDATMAAHLASSVVRFKWATPRHSVNISLNGVIAL